MRILLLRHGETDFNKKRIMQGQTSPEVPLNKKGAVQANGAARFLKKNFHGKISCIFTSPLKRAVQTSIPVANNLDVYKVIADARLKEKHHGIYDGRHHFAFQKASMNIPYHEYRPPNGENYYDVIERLADFFRENLIDNSLIVSHGAATRSMISYLCKIPIERMFTLKVENCSVIEIKGKKHDFKYRIIKN